MVAHPSRTATGEAKTERSFDGVHFAIIIAVTDNKKLTFILYIFMVCSLIFLINISYRVNDYYGQEN